MDSGPLSHPTAQRPNTSGLLLGLLTIFGLLSAPILRAQVDWTEDPASPVVVAGTGWDEGGVFTPSVVQDGDTLRMWYGGFVSLGDPSTVAIGYAWSLDGVNWTKHPGNPVMTGRPGEWDDPGVSGQIVIQDGDTFRMWYLGGGCPDDGDIGYATSTDGLTWERFDSPVMVHGPPGEWNTDFLAPGGVIKDGGLFKMWFVSGTGTICGASPSTAASIGYATSPDGVTWTLYDDQATTDPPYQFSDPVLEHGPLGAWDYNYSISPYVLPTNTGYEMWYSGWVFGEGQDMGYATSPDGIAWTKHENNPVLIAPGWSTGVLYPSVFREGDTYRMWFQGWQSGFGASIGYATAPSTTGVEDPSLPEAPGTFTLHQNYPNPFNPATSIRYEVSEPTRVVLKVLNIIGQEIRTLVDEIKPVGFYEVVWDGRNREGLGMPSGVYLYRIEVQGFTSTRKMVLLQ